MPVVCLILVKIPCSLEDVPSYRINAEDVLSNTISECSRNVLDVEQSHRLIWRNRFQCIANYLKWNCYFSPFVQIDLVSFWQPWPLHQSLNPPAASYFPELSSMATSTCLRCSCWSSRHRESRLSLCFSTFRTTHNHLIRLRSAFFEVLLISENVETKPWVKKNLVSFVFSCLNLRQIYMHTLYICELIVRKNRQAAWMVLNRQN